jgi:hypothetical protein
MKKICIACLTTICLTGQVPTPPPEFEVAVLRVTPPGPEDFRDQIPIIRENSGTYGSRRAGKIYHQGGVTLLNITLGNLLDLAFEEIVDEEFAVDTRAKFLRQAGFTVQEEKTGEEALSSLAHRPGAFALIAYQSLRTQSGPPSTAGGIAGGHAKDQLVALTIGLAHLVFMKDSGPSFHTS